MDLSLTAFHQECKPRSPKSPKSFSIVLDSRNTVNLPLVRAAHRWSNKTTQTRTCIDRNGIHLGSSLKLFTVLIVEAGSCDSDYPGT
jgi:hypothetical protein